MGNPSSKSSFKNNNLSKEINFVGTTNNNTNEQRYSKYSGMKSQDRDRDNDVLTKFTWNYGGNSVYLTGSFNNWKKNIPMEKQGDQFCITLLLPRQIHQYKFIVDGEWRFSPEDATMSDDNGYINNYIDTTGFEPLIQGGNRDDMDDLSGPLYRTSKNKSREKGKKQQYAKYAPKLPPHYQFCLYLGDKHPMLSSTIQNPTLPISNRQINQMINFSQNMSYSPYSPYGEQSNMATSLTGSAQQFVEPILTSSVSSTSAMPNIMMTIKQQGDLNYEASLTQQQVQYLFKTPHCLPMPTHSTVDHVMTQQGQWYTAMAITQRFKQKYTTFTYYTIDRPGAFDFTHNNGSDTNHESTSTQHGHWIHNVVNSTNPSNVVGAFGNTVSVNKNNQSQSMPGPTIPATEISLLNQSHSQPPSAQHHHHHHHQMHHQNSSMF